MDVAELPGELTVAGETVRQDLSVLERHGLLRRVHGGAIPVERLGFEPALAARDTVLTAEKDWIAKAALAELPDEESILLDAGSNTVRLAAILPVDRQLAVLTNALPAALSLATRANVTVLFEALGLTKRAMIAAARRTILADHTKLSADRLARFGQPSDVDINEPGGSLREGDLVRVEEAVLAAASGLRGWWPVGGWGCLRPGTPGLGGRWGSWGSVPASIAMAAGVAFVVGAASPWVASSRHPNRTQQRHRSAAHPCLLSPPLTIEPRCTVEELRDNTTDALKSKIRPP